MNIERMLPLPPLWFEILISLCDAELHGYALIADVEQRTAGRIRLLPGTLYRALERLLDEEFIEERDPPPGEDQRRRCYRATSRGRALLRAEADRLAVSLRAARGALSDS